jgi:hypothetical protein
MSEALEWAACHAVSVEAAEFNPHAQIPFSRDSEPIRLAMVEFTDFLTFVNQQLYSRNIARLESMLMPANFSSIVGEFMSIAIPKYCPALVKNQYHNGHPDLIPAGQYPNDAVQYASQGIEIKASRYLQGWQGHNPEDTWLMVFVFESSRPSDKQKQVLPRPFRFLLVAGAALTRQDWVFAGRSETSRRTITASVTRSGYDKMMANWIYKAPPSEKR